MNQTSEPKCSVGVEETPKVAPKKVTKRVISRCPECPKKFGRIYNLRRHIRSAHPEKAAELNLFQTYDFNCNKCPRRFNKISNYRRHMRNVHLNNVVFEKRHKCPECSKEILKRLYIEHLTLEHNVNIETETYAISSHQTFLHWKENLERETMCKFIKERVKHNSHNLTVHYFKCHRSGYFQSKTKGIRKLKAEGSKKINTLCPASLRVCVNQDGTCEVKYVKTHFGHDTNLKHVSLTQSERIAIAEMISKNIPYDQILSDVKSAVTEQDRLHLLKRQDLHNIVTSFGINTSNSQDDNNSDVCSNDSDSSNDDFPEDYAQEVIVGDDDVDELNDACMKLSISAEVEKLKNQYLALLDTVSSKYQLEFMQKEFVLAQATIEAMQSDSPAKIEKLK